MFDLVNYSDAILALGALGVLLFVQVIVADIVGIRARHVPGAPPPADHDNTLFRASRVVGNSNETLGLCILAFLFCLFRDVNPQSLAIVTWFYVATRVLYALSYYADLRKSRSLSFGASLLALLAMLVLGFLA